MRSTYTMVELHLGIFLSVCANFFLLLSDKTRIAPQICARLSFFR